MAVDFSKYPEKFWHCQLHFLKPRGTKTSRDYAVINDVTFAEIRKQIVEPWHQNRPFSVAGTVVTDRKNVEKIQIVHTPQPQQHYSDQHYAKMHAAGIADLATDSSLLPFSSGTDYTNELLFSEVVDAPPQADVGLVVRLCERLQLATRILLNRTRNKPPYRVEDEYDVQDLLHALIRGYLPYSIQEDPLGKVAGVRAGRADISIEDLRVLIEVKYAREPDDQKKIVQEFSQDLVLYAKWQPLQTLIFLVYNSSRLRDPEMLQKLAGPQDVTGRKFQVKIILS